MDREKLLQEARKDFCHEFGAMPEDSGYLVTDFWDNTVVFATGRQEADAFMRVQKTQWQSEKITAIAVVFVIIGMLSLRVLCGPVFRSLDNVIMYMWYSIIALVIIFFGEIWKKVKSRRWKKIYQNKIYWYTPRLKHSAFSKM